MRDDDPGLPIKFGPCSNGEYEPQPLSPLVREAVSRAHRACDDAARRSGLSRRQFLLSVCGAATTLLALDACAKESAKQAGRPAPGGTFTIPSTATTDPEVARAVIAGDEFVFDIQGHLLEYDLNPATRGRPWFGQSFPQQNCGDADPRACFSINHFMDEVFIKSDTNMVVLSALPIAPEGSPLSIEVMDETRRIAERLCHDDRVLLHAQALPNVAALPANLDAMEAVVASHPIAAWKTFTNYPDLDDNSGNAWRFDDRDPKLAQVGNAFITKCIELGKPIICVHKGFSQRGPYASPDDIGPAAKAHPDAQFVVYHSGYEPGRVEGPYADDRASSGVNRLIKSMRENGIGPNQNVYAELGSTWWTLMRSPNEAAHLLGKLLVNVGEDNVLWGTDALFYGSPQDQIQSFRAFQITAEFQERYGYPTLTDDIKRKVLGRNGLRLYGVDPINARCTFTREELEQVRLTLPSGFETYGPANRADLRAFRAYHRGWP
jgi:hypothetical protein